jgi:chemotaxis protein methyltransferase CheR
MAMASLRLKISRFCKDHHLPTTRSLITRLSEEPELADSFIYDISYASPEMFRDPELWIVLRDQVLPGLVRDSTHAGILIPECGSPEEIWSMSILLEESGLDRLFGITATCRNEYTMDQIKNRPLLRGRYRTCQENYEIFHPGFSLDRYFVQKDGKFYGKDKILNAVNLRLESGDQHLVYRRHKVLLYRNRMISQNLERGRRNMQRLFDQAAAGTVFVIGIKESIENLGLKDRVDVISPDLNIFAKAG